MLDFSEYVEALSAFCLLSPDEVLKCTVACAASMAQVYYLFYCIHDVVCFFVFDDDKNGTIEGVS